MISTALPYNGSSGWSGSDTSRDRADIADLTGVTGKRQEATLHQLHLAGEDGLTYRELGMILNLHHGQASGVLSVLHKVGIIARLTERRNKCAVYVAKDYIADRETAPHKSTQTAISYQVLRDTLIRIYDLHQYEINEYTNICMNCRVPSPCNTAKEIEKTLWSISL